MVILQTGQYRRNIACLSRPHVHQSAILNETYNELGIVQTIN